MYKKQKVFRKYVFSSYRTNKLIQWSVEKKQYRNISEIRFYLSPTCFMTYKKIIKSHKTSK